MTQQKTLGSKIVEVSYSDGKKYKECYQTSIDNNGVSSIRLSDNCISRYFYSKNAELDKLDKNFPFFSAKTYKDGTRKIKYYHPSNEIYRMIEGENSNKGKDLSKYDLCQDVLFWVGIGSYKDVHDSYDLIFAIENNEQLKKVSEYYNLKFPLPDGEDTKNDEWHSNEFDIFSNRINPEFKSPFKKDFKYGSIKFVNNKPKTLKMYKSNYKGE